MEIYKDLTSPASKEFEKLLSSQLSKTKIEEGKIIEGKITLSKLQMRDQIQEDYQGLHYKKERVGVKSKILMKI